MSCKPTRHGALRTLACRMVALAMAAAAGRAAADQIDIPGPTGSGDFGWTVTVLPNGNIVVTDPSWHTADAPFAGAVHLYSPAGQKLATLTGSRQNDEVGSGGIVVLANGNFVVQSPIWNDGDTAQVGAATWVDGATGISGAVSAANSLVGTSANDGIGFKVVALTNGNYVVSSVGWDDGVTPNVGAVTWCNGATGRTGVVSPANSLVGNTNGGIGVDIIPLSNGNYVVSSYYWGTIPGFGAATWGDGAAGTTGIVSAANSLVGTSASNMVAGGGVVALANGNYVVVSPDWDNGPVVNAGAVTWGNGTGGTIGAVSAANSLVGTSDADRVGNPGVIALGNGNYVVSSPYWSNGAIAQVGAVTWGNGVGGVAGPVGPANSLIGGSANDYVGMNYVDKGVTALSNGNYVVSSPHWDAPAAVDAGAATWANGMGGTVGIVSPANSLIGTSVSDGVAGTGATALNNGNYVVDSPSWNGSSGAATWVDGSAATSGTVSAANSLVGSPGDAVGLSYVTALSDGNYVVSSHYWNNGPATHAGAVTWGNGANGTTGVVSPANSLVGTSANDEVGVRRAVALSDGRYFVVSPGWNNGPAQHAGAITWRDGGGPQPGTVSSSNSLVGTAFGDEIGNPVARVFADSSYVVSSQWWDNAAAVDAGAVSLAPGDKPSTGAIRFSNSVRGTVQTAGYALTFGYDATRHQLAVGRPDSNIVSLFLLPIFVDDFE